MPFYAVCVSVLTFVHLAGWLFLSLLMNAFHGERLFPEDAPSGVGLVGYLGFISGWLL